MDHQHEDEPRVFWAFEGDLPDPEEGYEWIPHDVQGSYILVSAEVAEADRKAAERMFAEQSSVSMTSNTSSLSGTYCLLLISPRAWAWLTLFCDDHHLCVELWSPQFLFGYILSQTNLRHYLAQDDKKRVRATSGFRRLGFEWKGIR